MLGGQKGTGDRGQRSQRFLKNLLWDRRSTISDLQLVIGKESNRSVKDADFYSFSAGGQMEGSILQAARADQ